MHTSATREPSLRGAPTYFRAAVFNARNRNPMAVDLDTGPGVSAGYFNAGFSLGGSLASELSDEAYEEFRFICDEADPQTFRRRLLDFLERELPGCMALVPSRRKGTLLIGVCRAIASGKLDFGSVAAERISEDAR